MRTRDNQGLQSITVKSRVFIPASSVAIAQYRAYCTIHHCFSHRLSLAFQAFPKFVQSSTKFHLSQVYPKFF